MIELLRPLGILEMVRTGLVAMTRGEHSGIRRTPGAQGNGNGWRPKEATALGAD